MDYKKLYSDLTKKLENEIPIGFKMKTVIACPDFSGALQDDVVN